MLMHPGFWLLGGVTIYFTSSTADILSNSSLFCFAPRLRRFPGDVCPFSTHIINRFGRVGMKVQQTFKHTELLYRFFCVAFSHFATHSRLECCVYSCGYFFTRLPKRVKYFDQFTAYPPISRFVRDDYSMVWWHIRITRATLKRVGMTSIYYQHDLLIFSF